MRPAFIVASLATIALLAGCMMVPGKFAATIDLRKDGSFSFSYDGEIWMLALSDLAEMANEAEAANAQFEPEACWDEETGEERECSTAEIAEQRADWEAQRAEKTADKKEQAEAMRAMLGGIDPSDPEAGREIAAKLERQAGWNKVTYLGNGLFDVEFAVSSHLDHDFAFPIIEGFPLPNMFVVANRRDGGQVRIEAPGFAPQGGGSPFGSMTSGMAGLAGAMAAEAAEGGDEEDAPAAIPSVPQIDGTFRIVTDGTILANNTDEGPAQTAQGSVLEWKVDAQTKAGPMALIGLAGQ